MSEDAKVSLATLERATVRPQGRWFGLHLPIYIGFAATGFCCALPGALLPTLLAGWHLDDRRGGLLFFLIWMGSALGALTVQASLRASIAVGCFLVAAAAGALAFAGKELVDPLMLLYGLGLGLTMTSISLLRQHMAPKARSIELVRLNLMWAIGACVCPTSVASALKTGSAKTVLLTVAAFFIALLAWTLVRVSSTHRVTDTVGFASTWKTFRNVPIFLVLMTMLTTGIEASAGAWLATYASRAQHGLVFTIVAPTCLWAGLLCSRLLGSFSSREDQLRDRAMALMLLVAVSAVLLVVTDHGFIQLGASFLLGFGLGPLYPILLGRVMSFYQGGWIFFLAGVSSAVMPWLTGILSTRMSSLHAGLAIPAAGAVILVILGLGSMGLYRRSFQVGKARN